MCGIFGYTGKKNNAAEIIFDGLKELEYRGYDSWGIAARKLNKEIFLVKKTGGKLSKKNLDGYEKKYADMAEWINIKKLGKIKFYNSLGNKNSIKIIKAALKDKHGK